jgi:hypothetical protein
MSSHSIATRFLYTIYANKNFILSYHENLNIRSKNYITQSKRYLVINKHKNAASWYTHAPGSYINMSMIFFVKGPAATATDAPQP